MSQRIVSVAPFTNRVFRGGTLTSSPIINSANGEVDIGADSYTFDPPSGIDFNVANATTSQRVQTFSGLSSGGNRVIYFLMQVALPIHGKL